MRRSGWRCHVLGGKLVVERFHQLHGLPSRPSRRCQSRGAGGEGVSSRCARVESLGDSAKRQGVAKGRKGIRREEVRQRWWSRDGRCGGERRRRRSQRICHHEGHFPLVDWTWICWAWASQRNVRKTASAAASRQAARRPAFVEGRPSKGDRQRSKGDRQRATVKGQRATSGAPHSRDNFDSVYWYYK